MSETGSPRPAPAGQQSGRSARVTTTARSWAELVETMHGGLALLDADFRLAFVSGRFLPVLGEPDDLVGHVIHRLLPALADDDPRQLKQRLDNGERIEFDQQLSTIEGNPHWYRLSFVPTAALGADFTAVVFAKEITATTQRLNQLRDATTDLTEVEDERRRRVRRDVHDGPIQLLAALIFRLGMIDTDEAKQLQQSVSKVASTLREVIEEFSPAIDSDKGLLLEQWIAPLLVGTGTEVSIEDHTIESGLAEAQAAFVLVYQAVRAVRDPSIVRTLHVRVSDDDAGERIVVTIPSSPPAILGGQRAARFRTVTHHALALGGTLTQELGADNIRTFSMWIPKLTAPLHRHVPSTPALTRQQQPGRANTISSLPPLSDAAWCEIVGGSPERMTEFDEDQNIVLVSETLIASGDLAREQVTGRSADSILELGDLQHVEDIVGRLKAGELVKTQWHRTDVPGNPRLIHLALSPRLDDDGQLKGFFVAADDRTDIDLLDELYQSALADLTVARHLAIEASIRRLEQPLMECSQLIEHIDSSELSSPGSQAIHTIKLALVDALRSIKNSSSAFTPAPLSIDHLELALRESLGTLLEARQIVVVNHTEAPPSDKIFEVAYRIIREAVNNAVLHGGADTITITLSSIDDGISGAVHDDGVGVHADELQHQPGHLGTRAMHARARERGGTCRIGPHPSVGTVVEFWLPHDPELASRANELALDG